MLRAHRIYIPKWLREKIFKIVDRSHLGMAKAKQALRSKVHWFNMDKDIESFFFVPFVPKIVKTQKSTTRGDERVTKSAMEFYSS